MLWVQEIPSYHLLKPTSRKIANRQDRRISLFPSSWPGLCRTNRVQTQDKNKTGKAYSLLSACSLTRAVHLESRPNQTAEEFILYLKRLIMRKGHPRKIDSYNEQSFVASAKWLNGVVRHEQLQNYLANQGIRLQFYLSRAPRWGVDNFRGLWAS